MRSMSGGSAGSTMKRTGISRASSVANFCGEKQKHSVFLKYRAIEAGAAGLFTKPIDFPELRDEIGRRLEAATGSA